MRKVRWGVISTANIGLKKVLPAMQRGQYCDIVGIASRELDSARTAAAALGIRKACGGQARAVREADCVERGGSADAGGRGSPPA